MKMISFMSVFRTLSLLVVMSGAPDVAAGAVNYTGGVYTQDFNSLESSGTSNPFNDGSTLPGWYAVSGNSGIVYSGGSGFDFTLPGSPTTHADAYRANNGSSGAISLYSYGVTDDAERALGSVSDQAKDFWYGLCVKNDTGTNLIGFSLTYDGEQWRDSTSDEHQSLFVFYRIGGTAFDSSGTWIQLTNLTFTSPRIDDGGNLNGNLDWNRTGGLTQTVMESVDAGENIWFAWVDLDYEGEPDHGLAIDNVEFVASTGGQWHVDAETGSDQNSGFSAEHAFKTIQAAADRVQAGDEVIIHQGVYNEQVVLSTFGTSEEPIVFRADDIVKSRVILTSADPVIRGGATWQSDPAGTNLYYISYSGENPARVLYDNVDLYVYGSLSNLNSFTTSDTPDGEGGIDGPRHGWYYDEAVHRLYVRLHTNTTLYGSSVNPNDLVMAVGPAFTNGSGFAITGTGPAYVQLNGITFETPGRSAIYTTASAITVQNCWFFGCPYGVQGNNTNQAATAHPSEPYYTASDIVIKRCEFTEGSTYHDAVELLKLRQATGEKAVWGDIWHRKKEGLRGLPSNAKGYECGIALSVGRDWVIRDNYIHDIFEGLANDSMSSSVGATIVGNVFARICDNGIETENHATNVWITQNVFLDNFEPFSCQPLGGTPWPGEIRFFQNVIFNTPGDDADLWTNGPSRAGARAVFKIGIKTNNVGYATNNLALPNGADFFNNSIYFPGGRLVNLQGDPNVPLAGVTFDNNLFSAEFLCFTTESKDLKDGIFVFTNNLVVLPDACSGAPEIAAGSGGVVYTNIADLGWVDPENGDFSLMVGCLARTNGTSPGFASIGAIQTNNTWFPPAVGPCSAVTGFADY